MKFIHHLSLLALFGSFAVAVPANILSLTLSVKEGDALTPEREVNLFRQDACQKICHFEKPQCPLGLYALHTGPPDGGCWTCCICSSGPKGDEPEPEPPAFAARLEAGDLKESPALVTQRNKGVAQKDDALPQILDACWLICSSHPMDCPQKWYGHKNGGCYTCCRCSSAFKENSDASCANKVSLPAAHEENKLGL